MVLRNNLTHRLTGWFLFLFIFFLFWAISYASIDPDFGWHLKIGEYILERGIPKTDPFSYTMPSFPYIDHEWLTNILIAFLYHSIGYLGLSLLFAFIATLALWIPFIKKPLFLTAPLILIAASLVLSYIGIRPQLITWLFLAILIPLVTNDKLWAKGRLFLPVFMLLWANIHGGFALGIMVVGITCFIRSLTNKEDMIENILIFILSLFATFINPYGYRVWYEILLSLSDSSLKWTISEWYPSFLSNDPVFLLNLTITLGFSFPLIYKYRRTLSPLSLILYVFFFLLALTGLRHIPLFILYSLFMVITALSLLYQDIQKIKDSPERFRFFFKVFFIFSLIVLTINNHYTFYAMNNLIYPQKAIKQLNGQAVEGNIFSMYNWGGYLIWKLPTRRVFIDGRMPSWRWKAPLGESNWAMKEYIETVQDPDYFAEEVINKYKISTILWEKPTPATISTTQTFITYLEKNGWQKIYEDEITVIYSRN